MVYADNVLQPSIFEMARAGDFRAISDVINTYLRPEGIYASVAPDRKGCLQVLVEFQQEPIAEGIVKFICHLLWKLNPPTVEGVRIMARFAGESEILWKQSVRIITPSRRVRRQSRPWKLDGIRFKTLRLFLLMGSALTSFILGCWVSYYEVMAQRPEIPTAPPTALVTTAPPPKRPENVQAALEVVPVIQHKEVLKPHDPTVTLMFGGDVTLANSFEKTVGQDYAWAFAPLNEYREADVAMVNLENPLTRSTLRRPDKQFNFKADPEAVKVLTEGGIDIVNLANNHTMDYEESGLVETLETLEKAGIHSVGAGRDLKQARRPTILEVKGQRIAYFGYYDADFHAATEAVAGTNPRYDERVAADIQAVRDQVDWIIVNYHWGVELAEYPGDWQIDLARFTIDQGADVVVGHHPHVLQGAEIYKGRPIVYSLGNFIFGGNSRSNYDTAVLRVALNQNHKMKVEFLPIEVKEYQARVVKEQKGEEILRHVERISQIFDQPMPSEIILDASRRKPKTQVSGADNYPQPSLPNLSSPKLTPEASLSPTVNPTPNSTSVMSEPLSEEASGEALPASEQPSGGGEDLKPFIQYPFIKDPFISLPKPIQQQSTNSQSYNNASSSLSFDLSTPLGSERGMSQDVLEVASSSEGKSQEPYKGIELPLIARRNSVHVSQQVS